MELLSIIDLNPQIERQVRGFRKSFIPLVANVGNHIALHQIAVKVVDEN
jgi:hypothetical protein